jgi:hypothetical protein
VQAASALQHGLSIVRGPVLALALCRMGGHEPDRLIIALHHSVWDAYSLDPLFEDFMSAYSQLGAGQTPVLPPVPTRYAQYLRALASYGRSPAMDQARAFWLDEARLRPLPPLPVDLPGGRHTDRNSRRYAVVLSDPLCGDIRAWLSAHADASLNDLLLYGVARAYVRWTGAAALRLDLEHHGRTDVLPGVDLVRTIGPTTLKVPVVLEPGADQAPERAYMRVRRAVRDTLSHILGHGMLRYGPDEAARQRLIASGAPQIFFNNRGLTMGRAQAPVSQGAFQPLLIPRADGGEDHVSYDLMIECDNTPEGPTVAWIYSSALHREQTMEALANDTIEQIHMLLRSR